VSLAVSAVTTSATDAAPVRSSQRGPSVSAPPSVPVFVTDRTTSVTLRASDPDGDPLSWSIVGLPQGATFDPGTATLAWTPSSADIGRRSVYLTARDPGGRAAGTSVSLVVRAPSHANEYLALGDSVPAGHGLDWSDYERTDPCWRARDASYPGTFFARWRTQALGRSYQLLACSGATAVDLLASGGQIDQARARNPGLVTITIGANDLGFVDPERLLPGGTLDQATVDARLDRLGRDLVTAVARLVDGTDARILVTTYHDPTADDPVGVPGCRGSCFRRVAGAVVADLNATITAVARSFPASRVGLVDMAPRFVGHGAPNGWGPDIVREAGLPSWVPGWILPEGTDWALEAASVIHPYCADGHNLGDDPNWVSGVDCVHPNEDGARAYADAVWDAWLASGWR
jgi:lysophospholipase L1-like esterase